MYDREKCKATKRRAMKLVRHALVLAIVAIVVLACQVVVLPRVVRHVILSRLAEIGLSEATLQVRSCSWRSADFADVRLGRDRCACIGSLTANYSPASLIRGKLKKVTVIGGQLLLRIQDGKLQFGKLAQIKLDCGKRTTEPPFESIELKACTLSIYWDGKHICIPCEGSILNAGSGRIVHDLRLHFQGTPLQIRANLYTRDESIVASLDEQDMDLRTLLTLLPAEKYDLPVRFAGGTTLRARADISRKDGSAVFSLAIRDAWLKTALGGIDVTAEKVTCELKVELGDRYKLATVNGNLMAETVLLGSIHTHAVKVDLETIAGKLVCTGGAHGDKWRLKSFSATLPQTFAARDDEAHAAEVSWELEGHVPDAISAALLQRGIDTAQLGSTSITGRLLAKLSKPADFELKDLQIRLTPGKLAIPSTDMTLQGLSAMLRLSGSYSKNSANVTLLPDSSLQVEAGSAGSLSFARTRFAFPRGEGQNTAAFTFGDEGPNAHIKFTATAGGTTVSGANDRLRVDAGPTRLVADASLSPESSTIHGTLEVESLNCHPGRRGFSLNIQRAVLDASFEPGNGLEPTVSSVLKFDDISLLNENSDPVFSLGQPALRPLSGSFGLRRGTGQFRWECPVQEEAVLKLSADLDLSGGDPSGSLTVTCDGLRLDRERGPARALANTMGMAVSGDFTLRGKLDLQRGRLTPRLTVAATDAAVSSTRYQAEAEGITGSVTFTGLSPLSTPGGQYFAIRSLRLGKLDLRHGSFAFRLENDPPALFIERTRWGWLGGHIYKHALRIGAGEETASFRVFAEGLDLGELLGFAFGDAAAGGGKLYGMIPVDVSTSDLADFHLGEGFLYASSTSGWWELRGRSSTSAALKAIQQQLEQVSATPERTSSRQQVLPGLLDFEYRKFHLDFLEDDGGIMARITTQGRSRNRKTPVDFEQVVLDIPGFDEVLRNIMIVKRATGQSLQRAMERPKK